MTLYQFPVGEGIFLLRHCCVHSTSYAMGSRSSFPRGKAAGSWSWTLTSI